MSFTLNQGQVTALSAKATWILDVDDCMYDHDNGLHDFIRGNIVRVFNDMAAHSSDRAAIVRGLEHNLSRQGHSVANPSRLTTDELGVAFPAIVETLDEVQPDNLFHCLNQFYGSEYERIKPCDTLVKAFGTAMASGIVIYFYTNGPSGHSVGTTAHLQHVLQRRGFDAATIEHMRGRTYDLLMSVYAGYGKPTPQGMKNFLTFSGVDPASALMADDGVKNLQTAKDAGIDGLWTWTSDKAPPSADTALAEAIRAPRVRDTGAALFQIAQAHAAKPRRLLLTV